MCEIGKWCYRRPTKGTPDILEAALSSLGLPASGSRIEIDGQFGCYTSYSRCTSAGAGAYSSGSMLQPARPCDRLRIAEE